MDNELTYVGKTVSSPFIRAPKKKHFIIMDVTPYVAAVAAPWLLFVFGCSSL